MVINIIVIEDDEKLNELICICLSENSYNPVSCMTAMEAFDKMIDIKADLIISDIMMPEVDGFKLASLVREQDKTIPIMFISSRDDLAAKEKGFRIGIDDYMVKPLDMNELLLRIGALLRRAKIANEKKLVVGGLTLNADELTAYYNGSEIPVTPKEFQVLYKLLSYPKKVFTRIQLMDEFWAQEIDTTPRSVDVYVTKLREKFTDCKEFEIVTVYGMGYKAELR